MLTNGKVTIQFGVVSFTRSVWLRSAWMDQLLSYPLRNRLLDAILKSLRCSPYVLTITVALIFIYDKTFLNGRQNIFAGSGSMHLDVKDQAGADKTIAAFHSGFDFFFQVCGGLIHLRHWFSKCSVQSPRAPQENPRGSVSYLFTFVYLL